MKYDEITAKIDFNNIQDLNTSLYKDEIKIVKYCVDSEGNFMFPLRPTEVKLIEWIKILEERINTLEEVRK